MRGKSYSDKNHKLNQSKSNKKYDLDIFNFSLNLNYLVLIKFEPTTTR